MREDMVSTIARLYYPEQRGEADEVLVYFAYDKPGGRCGVDVFFEPCTGEPVVFARMGEAARFCDALNARQSRVPVFLPLRAMQFLLRHRGRARWVVKQSQRFLVVPVSTG